MTTAQIGAESEEFKVAYMEEYVSLISSLAINHHLGALPGLAWLVANEQLHNDLYNSLFSTTSQSALDCSSRDQGCQVKLALAVNLNSGK